MDKFLGAPLTAKDFAPEDMGRRPKSAEREGEG